MKKYLIIILLLVSQCIYAGKFAAIRVEESELTWNKTGDGVWTAPIAGDPGLEGMYVLRIKLAKGVKSDRHYHRDVKVVTVLSGSIYVGYPGEGDEWDLKKLGAGGIYTEPRNHPHFVWAKDEEAVVQIVGYGPTSRTALDGNETGP